MGKELARREADRAQAKAKRRSEAGEGTLGVQRQGAEDKDELCEQLTYLVHRFSGAAAVTVVGRLVVVIRCVCGCVVGLCGCVGVWVCVLFVARLL